VVDWSRDRAGLDTTIRRKPPPMPAAIDGLAPAADRAVAAAKDFPSDKSILFIEIA